MTMRTIWTTHDKRKLYVDEMHSQHITNCINMMRRAGYCSMKEFLSAIKFADQCGGDGARDAAAEAIADMRPHMAIDVMEKELAKRESDKRGD